MGRRDARSLEWSARGVLPRLPRHALDPLLLIAVVGILGLVAVALVGERIAPHESIYFVLEHGDDPRPYDPGLVFPFGSDLLGRDLLSLVLAGARTTLTIVLLGGVARVLAGVFVAVIGSWWRPARIVTESVADLVSAVPATLVALALVKVFVKGGDASVLIFIGALLATGWAGPYRVIRAEVDRLGHAPFAEGAAVLGVGRWRLFWRHQLPHLVPVLAMNLTQQVIATLVLVAELGVLGTFVGSTRFINITESLRVPRIDMVNFAQIADPPEWGGLLANARTIESLWTTRWLIFVPGVAFAITAIAMAAIGSSLARRYARRDITDDLRSRGAIALVLAVLALFIVSTFVPERYAAAREWAAAARSEVRLTGGIEASFADAGLRPVGPTYAVEREAGSIVQKGPAVVQVETAQVTQVWPRRAPVWPDLIHVQSFVTAETGGGAVEAPLVFVGRGISAAEHPPAPPTPAYVGKIPDLGLLIKDYADDYAAVDVRGKVVLVVRFLGVAAAKPPPPGSLQYVLNGSTTGFPVDESISTAIKHGAAAVIFVDNDLTNYTDRIDQSSGGRVGGANPYLPLQVQHPPTSISGVPVVVVDPVAASTLLASTGLSLDRYFNVRTSLLDLFDDPRSLQYRQSPARELGVTARVAVPLVRERKVATSYVGEVADASTDGGRVVVWAERTENEPSDPPRGILFALARALSSRRAPFILVDLDPSGDRNANAKAVAETLKDQRISLVLVLDRLDGSALKFTTANGELIPAFDLYAENAGARHEVTKTTAQAATMSDIAPLLEFKTIIVGGNGVGSADLRPDAAALVGYLAGRLALGAEELPR